MSKTKAPPHLNKLELPAASHLLVRSDGVLCTVCGILEPVHAGDATPMPALIEGFMNVLRRHPATKHPREFGR